VTGALITVIAPTCVFVGREHAATDDRELYYLRTAQDWFYIAVGSFLAKLLALGAVLGDEAEAERPRAGHVLRWAIAEGVRMSGG
jgi:hypothetical protein